MNYEKTVNAIETLLENSIDKLESDKEDLLEEGYKEDSSKMEDLQADIDRLKEIEEWLRWFRW